eukprot:scaffold305864_cov19-Prasinocladus_malaysianus.AAC.1
MSNAPPSSDVDGAGADAGEDVDGAKGEAAVSPTKSRGLRNLFRKSESPAQAVKQATARQQPAGDDTEPNPEEEAEEKRVDQDVPESKGGGFFGRFARKTKP